MKMLFSILLYISATNTASPLERDSFVDALALHLSAEDCYYFFLTSRNQTDHERVKTYRLASMRWISPLGSEDMAQQMGRTRLNYLLRNFEDTSYFNHFEKLSTAISEVRLCRLQNYIDGNTLNDIVLRATKNRKRNRRRHTETEAAENNSALSRVALDQIEKDLFHNICRIGYPASHSLIQEGITPEDVKEFRKAHITSISKIADYIARGIQADQVKTFRKNGIYGFHIPWFIENGVSPEHAAFMDAGVWETFEIQDFVEKGVLPEQVEPFMDAGIFESSFNVIFYIENDIHPDQVKECNNIGIHRCFDIARFLVKGIWADRQAFVQQHTLSRSSSTDATANSSNDTLLRNEQHNVNSEKNHQIDVPYHDESRRSDADMKKISEAGRQLLRLSIC